MGDSPKKLPEDIEALQAALLATRAELASIRAQQSDDQALIAHLKLQIEKLNRDRYGPRSERTARLLDQLELTLEELEASATEDELAAEMAAAKTTHNYSSDRGAQFQPPDAFLFLDGDPGWMAGQNVRFADPVIGEEAVGQCRSRDHRYECIGPDG